MLINESMSKQFIQDLPAKILAFLAVSLFTMLAIVGFHSAIASDETSATQIVGWVENTKITGVDGEIKAKLDTGATTASINAEILEKPDESVESGGTVKFYFVDTDGNKTLFERPLERWVKIKGEDKRAVVLMNMCLAGQQIEGEVTLAERDDFNYAVLVGRNFLKKGRLAIDSADSFLAPPTCDEQASAAVTNQANQERVV